APGVAEPERGQQVERRLVGTAVHGGDPDQDVVGGCLGVLDDHVEVAVAVEDPGVGQLVLRLLPAPPPVLGHQLGVGEPPLRVLVERLEVGVGGRGVEVVVALLDVLAVVALGTPEPEQALLQDGVLSVPEREREAEAALPVADPEQPVLAPAVGAAPGVIVREVVPHGTVGGVVLAHRAPLALRQVRSPPLPVLGAPRVALEAAGFGIEHQAVPLKRWLVAGNARAGPPVPGAPRRVASAAPPRGGHGPGPARAPPGSAGGGGPVRGCWGWGRGKVPGRVSSRPRPAARRTGARAGGSRLRRRSGARGRTPATSPARSRARRRRTPRAGSRSAGARRRCGSGGPPAAPR